MIDSMGGWVGGWVDGGLLVERRSAAFVQVEEDTDERFDDQSAALRHVGAVGRWTGGWVSGWVGRVFV